MKFFLLLIVVFWQCGSQQSNDKFPWVIIPQGAKAIETAEESYPNGDGYRLVRYELDRSAVENIESQMQSLNSKPLPIKNEIVDDIAYKYLSKTDAGLYKIQHEKDDIRDIHLIVLNKTQNSLLLLVSFQ